MTSKEEEKRQTLPIIRSKDKVDRAVNKKFFISRAEDVKSVFFFLFVCVEVVHIEVLLIIVFETQREDKDYLLENQTFWTGCNTGQPGITSANDTRRDAGS